MPVQLNHTIVPSRDPQASAAFLADMLGRGAPVMFGPFHGVELDGGVTLDFLRVDGEIPWHHYAFIVSESEFDQIFERIRARELPYWADPGHRRPGETTTTTAAVASTGPIRTVTTSRSSLARTAAVNSGSP